MGALKCFFIELRRDDVLVEQLEGMLSLDIDIIFTFINISANVYTFPIQLELNTTNIVKNSLILGKHLES
jgi:hypothetical protein